MVALAWLHCGQANPLAAGDSHAIVKTVMLYLSTTSLQSLSSVTLCLSVAGDSCAILKTQLCCIQVQFQYSL